MTFKFLKISYWPQKEKFHLNLIWRIWNIDVPIFFFNLFVTCQKCYKFIFFQPVSDKKNLSVATDKFEPISHQVWISSILREMIKHLALFLPLSKPELPQKWLHKFLMHFGIDNIQTTVWNNMIMIF